MLFNVALRNVRRSVKDYAVYFLTLTIGVCLFYTFNSLEGQTVMQFIGAQAFIRVFIGVFSAFITLVLAGLILYANRFLMKRRKRELGTYLLLGLDTGKVARLLAGESLIIGLGALASGLALGLLASWGLDKLTVAMFLAAPPEIFSFRVSWTAVIETVIYFGAIFLLVTALTGVSTSRARLIKLVRSERENEEIAQKPLALSAVLFLLGVVSLGTAYAILLVRGLLHIDLLWFIMLGLGTLGSYLIFRSLSGFLLRLTKGHAGYYRGLNMFVLRQWSGKVHTNCLSNTILSILILLAIGATACAVGLNDTITGMVGQQSPYDLSILNYGRGGAYEEADFTALFRDAGLDPESSFSSMDSITVYYNDGAVTGFSEGYVYAALPLSAYNRVMAGRGLEELDISTLPTLTPNMIVNGPAANGILVVPDEMTSFLAPRRQMVNIDYKGNAMEIDERVRSVLNDPAFGDDLDLGANYRLDNYYDLMGAKLLILYIGLYLGLVFLVTAAAVLALQQLSQAADNVRRYEILSKLGAPEEMRRNAVIRQVALAFLLPLALGILHAMAGMTAANEVIGSVGHVDSVRSSVLTAAGLVVIYGGYFLATCLGAWRAVKG